MADTNPSIPPQGPQEGAARPNPAPPPPSSVIPDQKQQAANEALDQFYAKIKELNESIAKTNELVQKETELQTNVNDAYQKSEETAKKVAKNQEELVKEHKKYKDAQGNWIKGTESIQELFEIKMGELQAELQSASDEFEQTSNALLQNKKSIEDERDVRATAILSLRDLRATVKEFDAELGVEMVRDFNKAIQDSTNTDKEASETQKKISEETNKAADKMIEGLRKANVEELAENAKKTIEIAQKKADFDSKNQANQAMSMIAASGGMVGMMDIKEVMDGFGKQIDEEFKILNPDASDAELEKNREEKLLLKRKEILQEITSTKQLELQKKQEERIIGIMKEKGVSRDRAMALDSPTQKNEQKLLEQNLGDIGETLNNMNDLQYLQAAKADVDRIKDAERAAEEKIRTPEWAEKFIDGLDEVKELLDLMRWKEESWWKIILIVLVTSVGAVLGYIWKYIQVVGSVLTTLPKLLMKLPLGIGKAIGEFFGKIRAAFTNIVTTIKTVFTNGLSKLGGIFKGMFPKLSGGISKMFGNLPDLFKSFGGGLRAILNYFPKLTGFFGTLGKAFMFGFRVLGKVFFWIGLAVDVIMGMVKGFKEMPNIKGVLMGAVAGIVSFFTFGLLDFKKTFGFINQVFGKIFDAIAMIFQPLIDYFVKSFGYIKEAISKIIGIFSGEGSIFGKIMKTLGVLLVTGIKIAIAWIGTMLKTAFVVLVKLPITMAKMWIEGLITGIKLLGDAFVAIYDYIVSGEMFGDMMNLGIWIAETVSGFFNDIVGAIADGLGEIPWIGGYIKAWLGGGSASSGDATQVTKQVTEDAKKASEVVTETAKATTAVTPSLPSREGNIVPVYREDGSVAAYQSSERLPPAMKMQQAASSAATAQREAAAPPAGNVAINAPTTTVASAGGGQGSSPTLLPTKNRNTEPTFRALLFMENPAF